MQFFGVYRFFLVLVFEGCIWKRLCDVIAECPYRPYVPPAFLWFFKRTPATCVVIFIRIVFLKQYDGAVVCVWCAR